jgi:hypothetical protein
MEFITLQRQFFHQSNGLSETIDTSALQVHDEYLTVCGILTHNTVIRLDDTAKAAMIRFCGGHSTIQRLETARTTSYLTRNGNRRIRVSFRGYSCSFPIDDSDSTSNVNLSRVESRHYIAVQQLLDALNLDRSLCGVSDDPEDGFLFHFTPT